MRNTNLMMLAFVLLVAWGCKKDDEPVTTGVLSGTITDADTDAALDGVRIIVMESNTNAPVKSLTTGADGAYKTELSGGSYYLKLYRQGYDQVPPKGMSPLPFTVSVGTDVAKPYEMNPSAVQNGGYVKGKVTEAGTGVAGVLVVAEKDGQGYSAVTDAAGDYYIYNLPAGSYALKGWISGYSSEQPTVSVTTSAESTQNLQLSRGAAGSVSGTVTFLASNAREVDITLTHPLTKEAIPGLLTSSSQNYSIANVPAGTYIARASYQNDERVVDPDWIVKNGEPVVNVDGGAVSLDFSLTGSVRLTTPTNLATTTEPIEVASATPRFTWAAYSSTSDYVLEVSDANGNVIWGGFGIGTIANGTTGPVKKVIVPSGQTSADYNFDGSALRALEPGKVYRWKVYASKDDNKENTGWKLISVSEDQMGLIRLAE
ncbi:carboxypeptidase-like regulatory domain-containing protein [Cesiribacter sp. SM1]|uniref:carboxypeptidase-like regulatory domain-containing protein n=1 Tax=Cesiribacter sp. SM1 TaxID=2861196 RepID=UPI001CD53DF2|nr:carboxypeptidase-like regulatory domain-containing protein [Cesiribacter sp. SM1]